MLGYRHLKQRQEVPIREPEEQVGWGSIEVADRPHEFYAGMAITYKKKG